MFIFEWQGDPIPQQRPRLGKNCTYNPQAKQKTAAQWWLKNQYQSKSIKDPISLNITYYLKMPDSTSKKKKEKMLSGDIPATKKPDIDNLLKFTLDVMQGIVFDDDNQVVKVTASKCYGETPKTLVLMETNEKTKS